MPPPNDSVPLADVKPHPAPDEPGSHPVNRAFDLFLVLAFLAVVAVPLVGTPFRWDFYNASSENRALATFPDSPHTFKEATKYSDQFFDFFKDNFALRNTLIHHFQDARFHAGLLANNDKVLIGKDGWLFLSVRPDQAFRRERGLDPLNDNELKLWQLVLEKRTAYFKSRGIAYVVFFAPDKQTIYPEFMPDLLVPKGPSRLDQLTEWLAKNHSPVPLVDVRPAIRAAQFHTTTDHPYLYFKTDTHWNAYGAFAAYQQFLAAAQKQLPNFTLTPQTLADFRQVQAPHPYSGDLVGMLGLDNQLQEPYPDLARKIPYADNPATHSAPRNPKAPTLVMFHDSFGNFLPQLIGPHFDRAYFNFTDTIEIEPLNSLKPDLVITELVERKLYIPPPPDPDEINDTPLANP